MKKILFAIDKIQGCVIFIFFFGSYIVVFLLFSHSFFSTPYPVAMTPYNFCQVRYFAVFRRIFIPIYWNPVPPTTPHFFFLSAFLLFYLFPGISSLPKPPQCQNFFSTTTKSKGSVGLRNISKSHHPRNTNG